MKAHPLGLFATIGVAALMAAIVIGGIVAVLVGYFLVAGVLSLPVAGVPIIVILMIGGVAFWAGRMGEHARRNRTTWQHEADKDLHGDL